MGVMTYLSVRRLTELCSKGCNSVFIVVMAIMTFYKRTNVDDSNNHGSTRKETKYNKLVTFIPLTVYNSKLNVIWEKIQHTIISFLGIDFLLEIEAVAFRPLSNYAAVVKKSLLHTFSVQTSATTNLKGGSGFVPKVDWEINANVNSSMYFSHFKAEGL